MRVSRLVSLLATFALALGCSGVALAAKPAPPSAPDLDASSDSGSSASDNITNDSTPDFVVNAGVGYAGYTAKLYARNRANEDNAPVQVGSATVSSAGLASLTVAPALPQGSYDFTATITNTSAEESDKSAVTVVSLDLEAPTIDIAPVLYDVVISNQTALVTFTPLPRFLALVEPGASVTLWEGPDEVGSGTAALTAGGTLGGVAYAFVRVTTPLADGLHTIYATVIDVAGNAGSSPSPETSFVVDTEPPPVSKPRLVEDALATGAATTKSPRPSLEVDSEAGTRVTIYEDGMPLGAAVADATGVATVTIDDTRWLDPGTHCIYAIGTDANTNDSDESAPFCLTVEDGVPPFTSNLGVDLTEEYLTLSLRSTLAARATVRVHRAGKLVRVLTRGLRAKATKQVRVRLAGKGAVRVTARVHSRDGRTIVLRRTVRH